jgi:methylaspartate mutase epsilon subunit
MTIGLQLKNRKWDWDYFQDVRREVLGLWPTGQELMGDEALESAVEYQRQQPWWKFASLRNQQAQEEGRIQVVPQIGHALVEEMVEEIEYCDDIKPDRWYVLTDTYTRKSQFQLATEAVERSRQHGHYSFLNGYPMVTHGVNGSRRVNESTSACLGSDCNDEDARLAWEIALAGGWTYGNSKAVEQPIQHGKDYPLDRIIYHYQYQDRLTAYYNERGVPILRKANANLPGWDSLGFKVAVSLIECLLAAEQGVKYFDLSLGIGMNPVQDTAAMRVLTKLGREYLDRFGYDDAKIYPWAYFFLGDWPNDRDALVGQLCWNATVATLAGCNGMTIKSPDEASGTPTKEGFFAALKMVRQVVRLAGAQRLPEDENVKLEIKMIEAEVRAILERTLELGDGDLAVGTCRALEAGVLDTQFSPYHPIQGEVMVTRDREGALRYLNPGNLPLPPEVKDYHRAKLAEREAKEGQSGGLDWIIKEASWASRSVIEEASEMAYETR